MRRHTRIMLFMLLVMLLALTGCEKIYTRRVGSTRRFHFRELSEKILRGQDLGRMGRLKIQRRGSYPRTVCRNDYPS